MNYIYSFQNNMLNNYYKNLYNSFLLNNENENILILNQNFCSKWLFSCNPLHYPSFELFYDL